MGKQEIERQDIGAIESLLVCGDLAKLSEPQRVAYYASVCESLGLNRLTQPFEYIVLNGRLRLYATKSCTEQLRQIHGVSIEGIDGREVQGVYLVTAKGRDSKGRTDAATGAVPIAGLKGEPLANALMKAETKAKRRLTLSICGLGMLDESEIESIPAESRQSPASSSHALPPADDPKPQAAEAAAGGPRPNWQSEKWPAGAAVEELRGTLDQVSAKSGETNGKKWTRFGLRLGEAWVNTFDSVAARVAEANVGHPVVVEWTKGRGESRDMLGIRPDDAIPF